MRLCELESVHLFEPLFQVVRSLDDMDLRVDSLKNALGQSFNQDLDHSGAMDVK